MSLRTGRGNGEWSLVRFVFWKNPYRAVSARVLMRTDVVAPDQEIIELLEQLPEGSRAPDHPWREGQDSGQCGLMDGFLVFLETK